MASKGSWLTGFKRLHGTEFARPPRADIDEIRGVRLMNEVEGRGCVKSSMGHDPTSQAPRLRSQEASTLFIDP
jgi:hypothetical protein